MTRRQFLRAAGSAAVAGAVPRLANAGPAPMPNVVLIVADDLGYDDLGSRRPELKTPNIDSIANAGVRFTDGYVPCPVCAPTRASLLTGRYPQSFGFEFNPDKAPAPDEKPFGLPLSEKTIADRLRSAGYATGIIGKWHLGTAEEFRPLHRGFDEFFGFLTGSRTYYPDPRAAHLYNNDEIVNEREYLTDAFARKAESFIERHRQQPFFLYLPFNAVHGPLDPPPDKYLRRFNILTDPAQRNFAAILSALDDGVGRVLHALQRRGLDEQTLVIFLSDNGGTMGGGFRPISVRGDKGSLYEGGIRVPFMMKWPGRISPSTVYRNPVCAFDLSATILRAAGIRPASNCDGVNLLPFLDGSSSNPPHDALYWKYGQLSAVRQGDWKLLSFAQKHTALLYNLAEDQHESTDLASEQPAKFAELSKMLRDFKSLLPPPLWRQ